MATVRLISDFVMKTFEDVSTLGQLKKKIEENFFHMTKLKEIKILRWKIHRTEEISCNWKNYRFNIEDHIIDGEDDDYCFNADALTVILLPKGIRE